MQNDHTVAAVLSIDQRSQLVTFVESINVEQLDSSAVGERLRQLRLAVPDAALEVVSERENIGGELTHALLVTHGGRVYSLCCTRQNVTPWQLRGATNAEANHVLTVNGYTVTIEDAVHLVDAIWGQREISTRMIDMALLARETGKAAIAVSREELGGALRAFYSERQLEDQAARIAWLRRKGLSERRLETLVEQVVARRKIERTLVDARYAQEVGERAEDYAVVRVMQAAIPRDCVAAAESLLPKAPERRPISEIVAELAALVSYRHAFRIEYAELMRYEIASHADDVFGQPGGGVLLVGMAAEDTRLIEVLGRETELSDEALDRRVVRRLMNEWYDNQRRAASIEWHWGRSS